MPSTRRLSLAVISAVAVAWVAAPLSAQNAFVRGDANADTAIDIGDPLFLLFHVFASAPAPSCRSAADANDDGGLDAADALRLLFFLFVAGPPPAAPFPDCGPDPSADELGCGQYSRCAVDLDPVITEWTVPWASSRPRDPYVDASGRVWFVGQASDYAAYLEPAIGRFTRFNLPAGAGPHNLIVGDWVWYAGNGAAHIGRLDPESGTIDVLEMPSPAAADPHTLVFDHDGDIWFTVQQGNFVGKLTVATREVRLLPVPTANARPYGIVIDAENQPWFVEFGVSKLARIDRDAWRVEEFPLPRAAARPRRLGITSDGAIWYVDYEQGYLGRFAPSTRAVREWRAPGAASSRPYGMAIDHRDRIWFVETGSRPNRFVGFNPATERFFSNVPVPSGGGAVRHMYFDAPARAIWFGTDTNTVGRAQLD